MKWAVVLNTLALCLISFCFGWSVRGCDNERMTMRDTITDTTTIVVYDTITYRKPVAVDSVVVRYRTINVHNVVTDTINDTIFVQLPITQKTYTDSTYTAWVSGYDLCLDSIQVYPRTEYKTITNTIKVQDTKRWGIGIHGGVGVGKGGFTPYIGVGIQYNIIRF